MNLLQTVSRWFSNMTKHRADRKDGAERVAIAKAFNDRYTYRKTYYATWNLLPGTSYGGLAHRDSYAWMCPTCNTIHRPISDSVFSGLQYPACCRHHEGHRLDDGIRYQ